MMGRQPSVQAQMFYTGFNLERRVRADHPPRRIASSIDFDFSYQAVADRYGDNGNVSVPRSSSTSARRPAEWSVLTW